MADTITAAAQSEVAALAHRHLTLTYGLIGTVILLLVLMGFGGYLGLKSFDAALARQDAKDQQYQQDRRIFMDTLAAHDAERTADATKIAQLEAQIAHRDAQPLPKPVQEGLKPDATAKQAADALGIVYSATPSFGTPQATPDGKVALTVPEAQQIIQDKYSLTKSQGDLTDQKSINSLLNSANASLTTDLNSCKDLNTKAQADIAGYKKLAKRSKFRRFLDGAEKVAIFAAGAYVGHKL